jgi:hypothetical protein
MLNIDVCNISNLLQSFEFCKSSLLFNFWYVVWLNMSRMFYLFTVNFLNRNIYPYGRCKITCVLNRLLHEIVGVTAVIKVIIFYGKVIICLVLVYLTKYYSILHYHWKIGKINLFECVSVADMTHTSKYILFFSVVTNQFISMICGSSVLINLGGNEFHIYRLFYILLSITSTSCLL